MVRNATAVLFLVAMAAWPVAAQNGTREEAPRVRESAANPRPLTEGDVVTFKHGKQLRGLQVLRETARTVVLQVMPGSEPLTLSKRFIERIDYDDLEPTGQHAVPPDKKPEETPNIIVADRLSGDLHKNLNRPLPAALLESSGEDLVRQLEKLAKATNVRINIADSVRDIPRGDRQWRYKMRSRSSLESLLRESLLVRFERLRVLYKFDHIVVTTAGQQLPPPDEAN